MHLHPELHRAIAHDTELQRLAAAGASPRPRRSLRERFTTRSDAPWVVIGAHSRPPATLVATAIASEEEPCPASAV